MVAVAGTAKNTWSGPGNVGGSTSVTPPAGVAFLAFVTRTQGTVTPPSGWTEVYTNADWSRIYVGTPGAGTTWAIGGHGGDPVGFLAVQVVGYDEAFQTPTVLTAATLTSPATTASEAGLAVRALSALHFTNGDAGYPSAATLGRDQARVFDAGAGVGVVAAVAHQTVTAGSVASAAWTLPGNDGLDRTFTVVLYPVPVVIPDTPTGLMAQGGDREVDISFNPSANADSYLLRWRRTDLTPPSVTTQTSAPGHLVRINSENGSGSSYQYTYDGDGTLICAWDSGIRATHQEFTGRVVTGLTIDTPWNSDSMNHGTPVAANAMGTTFGVAKGAQITMATPEMLALTFDPNDIVTACNWVLGLHSADPDRPLIVTNSGPIPGYQEGDARVPAVDAALKSVLDAGIPIIVAIGNDDINVTSRLAGADPRIIWVGSTTPASSPVRTDSAYAEQLTVYAPCVGQITASSTSDTATQTWGYGTSGAAPMVAGVVAKIREANPNLSPERVKEIITSQGFDVVTSVPVGPTLLLNANSQSSEWSIYPTTSTTFTLDGLDAGATYEFQVAALNSDGQSAWSSSVFATTDSDNPPFFVGSEPVTAIYVGSEPVTAIYQGSTLVWEA